MRRITLSLCVLALLATPWPGVRSATVRADSLPTADGSRKPPSAAVKEKDDGLPKRRPPQFTVGKDTTHVTGPRDRAGYIDYASALNERLRQGVTPANNANVLLWRAFGPHPERATMPAEFFQWMGIESPPERGDYYIDLFRFATEQLGVARQDVNKLIEDLDKAAAKPWTPKQYPHLADWLKANEKPLALVLEATKRPHYFSPLTPRRGADGSAPLIAALLPAVQKCRDFANALTVRAMLRLGEGRPDDAWQDLLACHRLGRHLARGATFIEGLVGIAIDAVACGADLRYLDHAKLDAKQIKERLRELRRLPPMPLIADKVDLGERFMFLDCVMMVDRGGLRALAGLLNVALPRGLDAKDLRGGVDWDPALRNGNRWFDRLAAALRTPKHRAREKRLQEIETELKDLKAKLAEEKDLAKLLRGAGKTAAEKGKFLGNVLITLLVPAAQKVQFAGTRSEQLSQNLHAAFALAAYHREHGRYPAKLAALVPDYLPQLPQDVFADKPVVYRLSDNGYRAYSIGRNLRDERGQSLDDDPAGDDIGVRMPRK